MYKCMLDTEKTNFNQYKGIDNNSSIIKSLNVPLNLIRVFRE